MSVKFEGAYGTRVLASSLSDGTCLFEIQKDGYEHSEEAELPREEVDRFYHYLGDVLYGVVVEGEECC